MTPDPRELADRIECATCGGATYPGREFARCDGCDQAPTFCTCVRRARVVSDEPDIGPIQHDPQLCRCWCSRCDGPDIVAALRETERLRDLAVQCGEAGLVMTDHVSGPTHIPHRNGILWDVNCPACMAERRREVEAANARRDQADADAPVSGPTGEPDPLVEAIRGALEALAARIEQGGHVIREVSPEEFAKSVRARLPKTEEHRG